ncbi:hypothetical protein ACIHAR_02985 [Streptomyces sp. NPDC052016]|uniref:hypothetical protein n=1 Tax=Streptomyces sp. NPDC052016 TaxID=3365680 RepID=UPI0037D0DFB4
MSVQDRSTELRRVARERFGWSDLAAEQTREPGPSLFVVDEAHSVSAWDTISVPTT